jgi:hypothetical protein
METRNSNVLYQARVIQTMLRVWIQGTVFQGGIIYLCGAPVSMRSAGQKIVALSVAEAELVAAGQVVVQDMLSVMRLMESIGLKVMKPMILVVDNKGTVEFIKNWSYGGRTRRVDARKLFLRELKAQFGGLGLGTRVM